MRSPRRPKRFLFLERIDHGLVIEDVHFSIQRAKPGLMRKQLRERDRSLAGLSKLRPEFCDTLAYIDLLFLQCVEHTGTAQTFGRRPNQDQRV